MGSILMLGVIAALIVVGGAFVFLYESKSGVSEKALGMAALGKYTDARAMVRDQLDLNPDDPHLHFLMSKIYGMEGDMLNEAQFLEKILSNNKFTKEITPALVTHRIASIYYQKDMLEESFFYYLDSLDHEPGNVEALIRLGFMCLGQKEFDLADRFFRQIRDDAIKFPAYFIGKGIVAVMLERNDEHEYFKKAFEMDQKSTVGAFLYALSLFRMRRFQDALDIANSLIDVITDDYLKYTIFQFIMVQYMCLSDYVSGIINAKLCIELAQKNDWEPEIAESNLYCGTLLIAKGDLEDASEHLIEAEFRRASDPEIVNLANYKYDLEEGIAKPGITSPRGYNFKNFLQDIPDRLFPSERSFDLSGLKANSGINIRGMVSPDGIKTLPKLNLLTPDRITRFITLKGNAYKNICAKIVSDLGFKIKKELPCMESEGANYLCVGKQDETNLTLFRFRRWKNITISDLFIIEFISNISDQGCRSGYLVGSFDLSSSAKRVIKQNDGKVNIVAGRDLDKVLEKALK